jgi:hypothetical protein
MAFLGLVAQFLDTLSRSLARRLPFPKRLSSFKNIYYYRLAIP